MFQPNLGDHPSFYQKYIDLVSCENINDYEKNILPQIIHFFSALPVEKRYFRYQEGKWSIAEIIRHLMDTERIFSYRSLWIVRKAEINLPPFDENKFASEAALTNLNYISLLNELSFLLKANLEFYKSLTTENWKTSGLLNLNVCCVNSIFYFSIGHILHHINVCKERYL
ncbi:MAG: DinB family protein [Sediminibacterium sp.]|nr:DinB family protein [Sediminibacterium sp.]